MCGWEGNEGERKEKEKQRMEEKGLDEGRHRAAIDHVKAFLRSLGPEGPARPGAGLGSGLHQAKGSLTL